MTRLRILFDADDVAETLLEGWEQVYQLINQYLALNNNL